MVGGHSPLAGLFWPNFFACFFWPMSCQRMILATDYLLQSKARVLLHRYSNVVDLLNPPAEVEKRKYKLKRLVQSPNSFFFFMVIHKLCDLSSTIEMKKINGGCIFHLCVLGMDKQQHTPLSTEGAQKKTAKTNMLTQDSKKLDNKKLGELQNKEDATLVVQA
ncbi:hypothetical protein Tco_1465741 [Tanacetum coccineum]